MRTVTARETGCARDGVTVWNADSISGEASWMASCQGRTYRCSGSEAATMSCLDQNPPAPKPAAAHSHTGGRDAGKRAWTTFEAKKCSVSVLLPATDPVETSKPLNAGAFRATVYTAEVELGDGAGVGLSCTVVSGSGDLDAKKTLDGAQDGMARSMGATVEVSEEVALGDASGRDLVLAVGEERLRARVVIAGRRVITLTMAPARSFSDAEARAFFASLSIDESH